MTRRSPDWLPDFDGPPTVYVYRVLYLANTIEPLELLDRGRGARIRVFDPINKEEGVIPNRDVFNNFEAAKERLVALNEARVRLAREDLARAERLLLEAQSVPDPELE